MPVLQTSAMFKMLASAGKTMCIVSWDAECVVLTTCLPSDNYSGLLCWLTMQTACRNWKKCEGKLTLVLLLLHDCTCSQVTCWTSFCASMQILKKCLIHHKQSE